MTTEEKAKAYDEAIKRARNHHDNDGLTLEQYETIDIIFPELKESEDEQIRKELLEHCINRRDGKQVCVDASDYRRWADWLEKQGEQKPFDYEHANIQQKDFAPKVELEKQGEQKPIEWDVDDDDKFFFLKARLKDYEDCIIYDEELSEYQKNNVRETTKEFLEWLDSIKERIGG